MSTVLGATSGTRVFGPTASTDDVLAGIDLQGKRILVTGVSAGLGVGVRISFAGIEISNSPQIIKACRPKPDA